MTGTDQTAAMDVLMHSGFTGPFIGVIRHFDPYWMTSYDAHETLCLIIDIVSDDYQGMVTLNESSGQTTFDHGIQGEHIWSMTDTSVFRSRFLEMVTAGVPVLDAFSMSYRLACRLLEAYGMADGRDDVDLFIEREAFVKRILMMIARTYLDAFINTWEDESILFIREVFSTYALSLSGLVTGIITTEPLCHPSMTIPLFETLGVPVLQVSKGIPEGSKVLFDPEKMVLHLAHHHPRKKMYPVPTYALGTRQITLIPVINDTRLNAYAHLRPWFQGVALTDTSVWTVSMGRPLVRQAQELILEKIIRVVEDNHFYIRMPDFNPLTAPFPFDVKRFSDPAMLMAYKAFFKTHLRAIEQALNPHQTSIILPFLGHPDEMSVWKAIIQGVYKHHGEEQPRIGVMIESEPLVEVFEAFDAADFIIFNLDRITLDLFENLDVASVMWTLKTTMRDMHQRSRERHIEHYVTGRVLSRPQVMDKVLKMGFRGVMMAPIDLLSVTSVIDEFVGNKDKYKGVHARRMAIMDTMRPINQ